VESIFDVLSRTRVDYKYLMFPVVNCDDDRTLTLTLESIGERRRLYFVQFSDSDLLCHLHGPESAMRHRVAGELDRKLRVLQKAFEERFDETMLLVIGDHGMMQVEHTVDVGSIVHRRARTHGLRHGKDYLLFLDSTLARLWALRPAAADRLVDLLEDPDLNRAGIRLTESAAREYRIPYADRRYGDLLWWANPGVLIHPDYFHAPCQIVRGMHGYASRHEKMQGFAVLHGSGIRPTSMATAHLVDVCSTLCEVLGVSAPAQNEGRSFLAALSDNPGRTGTR
jgi:predicted AlkP superfamily pyrophosphatase or phosphodiesterase